MLTLQMSMSKQRLTKRAQASCWVFSPLKAIPESQSLITSPSHNRPAVWTHREIEDPESVAGQACDLGHAGILPQDDLILTVAVRADDFIAVLGPLQVTNL